MTNEQLAIELSNDRKRLKARFQETVSVLRRDRYAKFFQREHQKFDFDAKRLYGANGFYLQWSLRPQPDQPESYENQQTSIGIVNLERIAQ